MRCLNLPHGSELLSACNLLLTIKPQNLFTPAIVVLWREQPELQGLHLAAQLNFNQTQIWPICHLLFKAQPPKQAAVQEQNSVCSDTGNKVSFCRIESLTLGYRTEIAG